MKDPVQCSFEEWDKERHAMGHCREIATHRIGNRKLCKAHADYAMSLRNHMSGVDHRVAAHPLEEKRA
jgi:hypothetical protein